MAINKRRVHHLLVVVRKVKTWQLLIILALFIAVSVYALRQNNLGMVELRNLVKQADEDDGDVQKALSDLQRYVTAHMNTSLGEGIFLEHSYQRTYDAAVQAAASAVNPNSQAYKDIEAICRQDYVRGGSFRSYIGCVETRLKAIAPGADPLANVKPLPAELFTHNFVSPVWSVDLAGFAVLASLVVTLLILLSVFAYVVLRIILKLRTKH